MIWLTDCDWIWISNNCQEEEHACVCCKGHVCCDVVRSVAAVGPALMLGPLTEGPSWVLCFHRAVRARRCMCVQRALPRHGRSLSALGSRAWPSAGDESHCMHSLACCWCNLLQARARARPGAVQQHEAGTKSRRPGCPRTRVPHLEGVAGGVIRVVLQGRGLGLAAPFKQAPALLRWPTCSNHHARSGSGNRTGRGGARG